MKTANGRKNLAKAIGLRLVLALFFVSALMVLLLSVFVDAQMDRHTEVITELTQNHLMSAAQALAALVSAEELDRYHTAQDTDNSEYRELRRRLILFAEEHNVLYAYYWRDYGNGELQYIVDNDTDPESQVGPDSIYEIEDVALDALSARVGSTDLGTYTPTWDGLITGYSPVFDRDGNFYCVAGIDVSDEFIFTQRRDSRNMTILQVTALSVSVIFGFFNVFLYRQKNRQAEKANTELQKASQAKSDFLAVMSHEIRTPLNAVIGLSQIELQNQKAEDLRFSKSTADNISQIYRSGSYLLGIINDILDISKIESGNFDLFAHEYDTASLIGDAVNLNRVRIGSKPINFILEISGDFPRTLKGDELRVKQILNNLLSNAVKYTQEGTITLSVEWIRENSIPNFISQRHKGTEKSAEFAKHPQPSVSLCLPERYLGDVLIRFTVKDSGIGIRPEDMEKLFSNYVQLDSGTNRKTEGTGLGLPIAKKLASLMGGSITVQSEYGKGSVFTAQILQGRESIEGIGEETAEDLRNFRYTSDWQEDTVRTSVCSGTVLVVDDLPVNLKVACGLLSLYGLHIDTAASGSEAIELVKNNNYDLIFIDHLMPGMDGVQTTAAIRALEKETKIVALTSNAMRGMKEYYLEKGFDGYLSKPINAKELDKMLVKCLGEEIRNNNPSLNITRSFADEIESQRLDKLNHYRLSFEIGKEFEAAYFKRFTALVSSLETDENAVVREQTALLKEAGQKEDVNTIRKTLPALCETLQKPKENTVQDPSATAAAITAANVDANTDAALDTILPCLKKALQDGRAEEPIREMGTMNLSPQGRKLYFTLYDLLLRNDMKKALEMVEEYPHAKPAKNAEEEKE